MPLLAGVTFASEDTRAAGAGADLKQGNVLVPLLSVHRAHPLLNSLKSQRRSRKGVKKTGV
jgi:hypothetical protein